MTLPKIRLENNNRRPVHSLRHTYGGGSDMKKFYREMLKQLPRGWTVEQGHRKHPRLVAPDGEQWVIGSTPKNIHYAITNNLNAIRKNAL